LKTKSSIAYLLDASALIPLLWPAHDAHALVQRWFAGHGSQGWATCPFTQAAFVRLTSNPAFSRDAMAPQEALRVLEANLEHPAHQFWPDDIPFAEAARILRQPLTGHQQITDAYLVGLAIHNRGKLATMDRGIVQLAPPGSVELIS
jgi:hypothetical protein